MSCIHSGPHQPGRLPYPEALPRRPGPCAAHGLRQPDSALELFVRHASAFVAAGPFAESPHFLHADFAAGIRAAFPSDPVTVLTLLTAAAQAQASSPGAVLGAPPAAASPLRRAFAWRDGLLRGFRLSPRGGRLCVSGRFRRRCCMSRTPLRWAGDSAVIERLPWRAAWCGGPACRPRSRNCPGPTCPSQHVKADQLPPILDLGRG